MAEQTGANSYIPKTINVDMNGSKNSVVKVQPPQRASNVIKIPKGLVSTRKAQYVSKMKS